MERKRRVYSRVVFLMCLVSSASLTAQSPAHARKLEAEGKTADAVAAYKSWLNQNTSHVDYVNTLLHTAGLMSDITETIKLLSGSLTVIPRGAGQREVLRFLAQLEEMSGRMEEAQRHYEDAAYADSHSKDFDSLLNSATLLFSLGDFDGAEARSRLIFLTCEDARIVRGASILYSRIFSSQERFAHGIETIEKLRKSEPEADTPSLLFLLGWLYYKNGNAAAAESVFSLLRTQFSASPEASLLPGIESAGRIELYPEPSLLFEFADAAIQGPARGTGVSGADKAGETGTASARPEATVAKSSGTQEVLPSGKSAGEQQSVQTGSYTKRENAEELKGILAKSGYTAEIRLKIVGTTTYYRVLIPVRGSIDEARQIMMKLKDIGIESFLIFD